MVALAAVLSIWWQLPDMPEEEIAGFYVYRIPVDDLQSEPIWTGFVIGPQTRFQLSEGAEAFCYKLSTVDTSRQESPLSRSACAEGVCHE